MSLQEDGKSILSGFRSRFRSSSKRQNNDYDDYDDYDDREDDYDNREDDYDDYEYGEYAEYDDDYDDDDLIDGEIDPDAPSYERYESVTVREVDGQSTQFSGTPRLVSLEDVRASIPLPSNASGDAQSARRAVSGDGGLESRSLERTMIDSTPPPEMTPEGTAAMSAAVSHRRAEGTSSQTSSSVSSASSSEGGTSRFTSSSASGRRMMTVIRPSSYEDAEKVVRALQKGSVVILVLNGVPETLCSRVLDFSFGAACVLGASVDSLGRKMFAIIVDGGPLSDAERAYLRSQGVL